MMYAVREWGASVQDIEDKLGMNDERRISRDAQVRVQECSRLPGAVAGACGPG